MTEVVISIKPEWVQKIFQLRKTWEIRKRRPSCLLPFKCFIWQTGGGGVAKILICGGLLTIMPCLWLLRRQRYRGRRVNGG